MKVLSLMQRIRKTILKTTLMSSLTLTCKINRHLRMRLQLMKLQISLIRIRKLRRPWLSQLLSLLSLKIGPSSSLLRPLRCRMMHRNPSLLLWEVLVSLVIQTCRLLGMVHIWVLLSKVNKIRCSLESLKSTVTLTSIFRLTSW